MQIYSGSKREKVLIVIGIIVVIIGLCVVLQGETMTKDQAKENSSSTILAEFMQGKNTVRVSKSKYAGKDFVDIRVFYDGNGSWLPTKKGISIRLENFPEFMKAVRKAEITLFKEKELKDDCN